MAEDPIQARVDRLAEIPGVELALLVFHPSPGSMEVRFAPQSAEEKWRRVEQLATKYRQEGESEELITPVSIADAPYQLVATTVNPFLKEGTPFIVALVAGEAVAAEVLEGLRSTIQDCMGAVYRR